MTFSAAARSALDGAVQVLLVRSAAAAVKETAQTIKRSKDALCSKPSNPNVRGRKTWGLRQVKKTGGSEY